MCSSYAGRQAEVIKRMFAKNSREGRTVEHGCGPLTHPSVSCWFPPPPQDDNSKASLILCVWHTSLILGQIRFQPLSSSPFRFPLFLFFFCFTHMLSIHTSFWDLVVAGQEMLTVRKMCTHCSEWQTSGKRESSLTFCVFICVLHHNKKTNKKKKLDQSLLPP